MTDTFLDHAIDDRGVATLTLNRPAQRNALDDVLLAQVTQQMAHWARSDQVRVVVITGAGDAFCAGTDISWMEHLAADKHADDARRLATCLYQIRNFPKPVIAKVNGPAMGAGVGLAVACDLVIAAEEAQFALPAVHLGAVPAVIGPFIAEAIGVQQTKRYVLTGETFSAMDARRLGLAHAVALGAQLDETVEGFVANLLKGGPLALTETKMLLNEFGASPPSTALLNEAAKISARVRRTDEAKEGLAAFIEKRAPHWR